MHTIFKEMIAKRLTVEGMYLELDALQGQQETVPPSKHGTKTISFFSEQDERCER